MIVDVRSDDGLRQALARLPKDGGWDGPTGRLIISKLWDMASVVVRRQRADVRDAHRVPHLVGVGWECLAQRPENVTAADSPWAIVYTVMQRRARDAELGDELGVSERRAKEWASAARRLEAHTARRIGVEQSPVGLLGQLSDPTFPGEPEPDEARGWDAALRELRDQLVDAGAPPTSTNHAISAVLEVLSTVRRSYVHTEVYRSSRFDGLNHDQRRALLELLIGTRRDGPRSSAWLALRQAPARGELSWVSMDAAAAARVTRFASPFRQAFVSDRPELALSA